MKGNKHNSVLRIILMLSVICAFCFNSFAAEEKPDKEEFNVEGLIMHHIKDEHSRHILDYTNSSGEKKSVYVHLPVILINDGKVDIFMSSEFKKNDGVVKRGDVSYINYHEKIYIADENGGLKKEYDKNGDYIILNDKPLNLSVTKNVLGMFVAALLVLLVFMSVAKAYKRRGIGAPKGLQGFFEPIIIFVKEDIVEASIGKKKSKKYLPYLLSVFFFILFNNLLGIVPLFPGGANVTGNIAVTMTLALFTMFFINVFGTKEYWKHIFLPPVPKWLLPIMIPVELIGLFTKPFALMIRLFANITAGHIIILSLISLIFIFQSVSIAPVSIFFVLFMNFLELLVSFLQAYIFTMLSALFIGISAEEGH
jgi:F-type H+-transporting ATPase subunit a